VTGCKLEPSLADAKPGVQFQFERLGYFCRDDRAGVSGAPAWNRTIELRDSWAKIEEKQRK
jgi:glutaminyl-tRNA synthetase